MSDILSKLRKEQIDEFQIPAELPPDLGAFFEPPQPGPFRLKLPENLMELWEPLEVKKYDEHSNQVFDDAGKPVLLQRVQLVFDRDSPLTVVQSIRGRYDGEPVQYRISNAERWRKVPGGTLRIKINDLIYLLRVYNPAAAPRNNEEFVLTMNQYGGREFGTDLEWTGYCNDQKPAYFARQAANPNGQGTETDYQTYTDPGAAEPRHGCGERVYGNKWPVNPEGVYADRAFCKKCTAAIRPFIQLRGFRA